MRHGTLLRWMGCIGAVSAAVDIRASLFEGASRVTSSQYRPRPHTPRFVGPAAAPLLNKVALTLDGDAVFGPFQNGTKNMCTRASGNSAECLPGLDISTCESQAAIPCGGAANVRSLMDRCGGHAAGGGYHYHTGIDCAEGYNATHPNGAHSPLLAIALDGFGLYGKFEAHTLPELDACGGHRGEVPGDSSPVVYHYHLQAGPPYTISCFGDPNGHVTREDCIAMYDTCEDGDEFITMDGSVYDPFCPCFGQNSEATISIAADNDRPLVVNTKRADGTGANCAGGLCKPKQGRFRTPSVGFGIACRVLGVVLVALAALGARLIATPRRLFRKSTNADKERAD